MLDCVRTTQARPAVRSLERLAETLPASVHVLYAGSAMIRQVCERAKWNPGESFPRVFPPPVPLFRTKPEPNAMPSKWVE